MSGDEHTYATEQCNGGIKMIQHMILMKSQAVAPARNHLGLLHDQDAQCSVWVTTPLLIEFEINRALLVTRNRCLERRL
jgi:hypothetical protein